jgi:hypothetical protein
MNIAQYARISISIIMHALIAEQNTVIVFLHFIMEVRQVRILIRILSSVHCVDMNLSINQ